MSAPIEINTRTTVDIPINVTIYDVQTRDGRDALNASLHSLPRRQGLQSWATTFDEDMQREAYERGIYINKLPKYYEEASTMRLIGPGEGMEHAVIERSWAVQGVTPSCLASPGYIGSTSRATAALSRTRFRLGWPSYVLASPG